MLDFHNRNLVEPNMMILDLKISIMPLTQITAFYKPKIRWQNIVTCTRLIQLISLKIMNHAANFGEVA